jgi:hypothetical protein
MFTRYRHQALSKPMQSTTSNSVSSSIFIAFVLLLGISSISYAFPLHTQQSHSFSFNYPINMICFCKAPCYGIVCYKRCVSFVYKHYFIWQLLIVTSRRTALLRRAMTANGMKTFPAPRNVMSTNLILTAVNWTNTRATRLTSRWQSPLCPPSREAV